MRTKVLILGSRTIPSGRHPSRHVFFYTKKYWTNIEFEKIMSDPMFRKHLNTTQSSQTVHEHVTRSHDFILDLITVYLLEIILDNWWILSEMCMHGIPMHIFCRNRIKNPYWIFTGFCAG